MPKVIDDKSQHCIPFLLDRLKEHQSRHAAAAADRPDDDVPPFFLGLNGVQGAGKTVLVSELQKALRAPPYSLPTVTLSLDDIYLTHADQVALANTHPDNPLLQHRGQPSTHDLRLGEDVFASLRAGEPTAIPQYDKSAFSGQGDRVPQSQWEVVNNQTGQEENDEKKTTIIKVVIFEGWCVGFRPLGDDELKRKWEDAVQQREKDEKKYDGRLGYVKLEDVQAINDALRGYDKLTDQLDALIHIDAQNTRFVYDWRQEQERTLLAAKGTSMTEEQVNHFVNGYYPSYELFTETLRTGVFAPAVGSANTDVQWKGRQLRLVVDRSRRVQEVYHI